MSFSSKVKNELSRHFSEHGQANVLELLGIIHMAGTLLVHSQGKVGLRILTENAAVARKYFSLVKDNFGINAEVMMRKNTQLKKNVLYCLVVTEAGGARKILEVMGIYINNDGELQVDEDILDAINSSEDCARAYLRGCFLGGGSVSDPEKNYHLEFVCDDEERAIFLKNILKGFSIVGKVIHRKNNYILYIKEGDQIVTILNLMEAHISLMDFENIRIVKEMRNNVNRIVNCETANLNKTISASVRQVDNIKFIKEMVGFEELPENLREVAIKRLEFPDASLKELGEMLFPPVGKSGVNHRLRKLDEMAQELKTQKGGVYND